MPSASICASRAGAMTSPFAAAPGGAASGIVQCAWPSITLTRRPSTITSRRATPPACLGPNAAPAAAPARPDRNARRLVICIVGAVNRLLIAPLRGERFGSGEILERDGRLGLQAHHLGELADRLVVPFLREEDIPQVVVGVC